MKTARTLTMAATASALVLAAGAGATASTHRASVPDAENTMTFGEWYNVQGGETQHNVQAPSDTLVGEIGCGCTGIVVSRWVGHDGHARKVVQYADTDTNSSQVQYRLTADGVWHTDRVKTWQTDGEGWPFYYDVPTF